MDTAFALLFLARSNLLGSLVEATFVPPFIPPVKRPIQPREAAKEILAKLLAAPQNKRPEFLEQLQSGRGNAFTDALVDAIPQLPDEKSKELARQALVQRFVRFKPTVLYDYMQDNERELRLAAVIAIRVKNDNAQAERHVIVLLADSDPKVAAAAMETLRALKK
ncbi:MAG: hypothetical protein QM703_13025 [Gemmatales bacterium]